MSDCACIYVNAYGYGDTIELCNENRKARKQHKCGECGRIIEPGEKYEYYAGLSDGDFFTAKTCQGCTIIRDDLFCEGWIFSEIWWEIYNSVPDIEANCLSELVLKLPEYTKQKLMDKIEGYRSDNYHEYCRCKKCNAQIENSGKCLPEIKDSELCECKNLCEVYKHCKE